MMRPTTAAAALALLLLASAASAWEQTCGACPVEGACNCTVCALDPVDLRKAARFVVLAGAGTTSSGPTQIAGDLGVGFDQTILGSYNMTDGAQYVATQGGDPAAEGFDSLTTAYNAAAGNVLCPISIIGNLGGLTLYPGLYKSTSGLEIDGSDLTLDAAGDASAVFIFQMATTFKIWTGRQVVLTNGTKAENIFWQVGSSATLYDTSVMYGTVMADQSISSSTGAVLHGRVLARIASVTMESAEFSLP
ncbi:hypothetical protein FOA52_006133 [Chlamydomonas sp. UWO 241]|nr:hypothetical protein FOA52_006133 [Chlamydomonas sp. UWO 241]